ncbi:MAG: F0F1 ATP synthase subunit B family protein [Desulfuromonadaceae bacterium]
MLIDWFTVVAQTINFLILVWLMKHFLYKPILNAIDQREKLIAKELADAATTKSDAQKERDEFRHKNEAFDQQRAGLLSKATDEVKVERQRLLDEARQAADDLGAKRKENLKNDAQTLNQAISRRTQQEVFAIARKALTDLAGTTLEERMLDLFLSRLKGLKGKEREQLSAAIKAAQNPLVVRTTFDLSAEMSASTEGAIKEAFGIESQIRFETASELISGIELVTDGHKVAWSIADYLKSMENGIAELLDDKVKPGAGVKPAPEDAHGA